jgi:hypothetical protein
VFSVAFDTDRKLGRPPYGNVSGGQQRRTGPLARLRPGDLDRTQLGLVCGRVSQAVRGEFDVERRILLLKSCELGEKTGAVVLSFA